MSLSPEQREQRGAAKMERFVRLGTKDGALDNLVDYGVDISADEAVDAHGGFTDARHFSLYARQKHASRVLFADTPGLIGFNMETVGEPGSLTVVKLPDANSLLEGTVRYLDTSGKAFRGLEEEDLCVKAAATAAHFYLSLGVQISGASEQVASLTSNGDTRYHMTLPAGLPDEGRSAVPVLGALAAQPA